MSTTAEFMWPKWSCEGEPDSELREKLDAITAAQADLEDAKKFIRQALIEADMWQGCESCHIHFNEELFGRHVIGLTITCVLSDHTGTMVVPEGILLRCHWCGSAGDHDQHTCDKKEW